MSSEVLDYTPNFKYNTVFCAQLLYAAVEGGEEGRQEPPGLCSVVLEPLPEKEVPITDPFLDLREVYLRELFVPNRFSAHTLRKALGVSYFFCISVMNEIIVNSLVHYFVKLLL